MRWRCAWWFATSRRAGGAREVPARLAWYTLFFAALYPVVGSRYDLAPAAVALAGALTWFGGRPVAGGLLTAAGTLLKVFPARRWPPRPPCGSSPRRA